MASRDRTPTAHARLRTRAALVFAGVTAATAGVAWGLGGAIGASEAYPLKAALVVPLLGAMAASALTEHGRPTLGPANAVTLFRAGLLGLVAGFLGDPAAAGLAWPLVFAGGVGFALDSVDGRVARATGSATPYGARLDMELDAITMVVLSALAFQLDRAGAWVLLAGALRYAYLLAGKVWPWLDRPLFPTERRRFVCGVAVTALLVALAPLPEPLPAVAAAVAVTSLVGSFGADTVWLVARRRAPL